MKTSIRIKILILGTVLSVLALVVSLVVSYFSTYNSLCSRLDESVDKALQDMDDACTNDIYAADYMKGIRDAKGYLDGIYQSDPDDPESFESIEDKRAYYQDKYMQLYYVYPDVQVFVMYPALLTFLRNYKSVISLFSTNKLLSGGDTIDFAYYDEARGRLITLVDNAMGDVNLLNEERFAGSYLENMEKPQEDMHNIHTYSSEKGKFIKYVAIRDTELNPDDPELLGYMFIEYDYEQPKAEARRSTLINFATLGAVSLLLIIIYALASHFFIVKNLNKLTDASTKFTKSLNSGEEIKTINPDIKSKDEIGTLSGSFVAMEDELINYINVIKEEAITKERMNAELNVASKIQLEALPNKQFDDKDISIRAFIQSAKEVGGDFYDYFYLDDTHLAFNICDVSGKGVPASLFMMRGKELIKSKLMSNNDIEQVLYDVNNSLLKNNEEGLFITSFVGIIDLVKEELTFVSAGHERPFIITDDGIEHLKCNANFILSGVQDFKYKSETIPFKKGSTIFLHTDGLNEAINSEREEFGYDRILSSLEESKNSSLDEKIANLNAKLKEFVGDEEAFDDETLLFVQTAKRELDEKYENPTFEVIEDVTNEFNNTFAFLDKKTMSEFGIIFDELLNNVVSYEKADPLILEVTAKLEKDAIKLTISSNGKEYNPLLNKDKYLEEFSEDLPVGGFGVTIVKNLVDSITYNRKDNKNVLTITKKI